MLPIRKEQYEKINENRKRLTGYYSGVNWIW